ncbi:MAG: hypothetical protein KGM15_09215 [Pseudomonadota bacterium]|nr:hypothetical protein [Pseudomonadota bacterium]
MKPAPPTLEAVAVGADAAQWDRLAREGQAAYRVELRAAARRRTRLQSAKILDGAGAFVCEAIIQDFSASGLRLLLARNCGLPSRVGVHVDLTGEVLTAAPAWRRERVVGLRVIAHAPPAPLKTSDRLALRGRYYAVRG